MNIADLAKRLGIGYWMARKLMHSTEPPVSFPSKIVGRTPVVDEAAYEKWYEEWPANEPIPCRRHGTPKFHAATRKPQRRKVHTEYISRKDFMSEVFGA